jgi:hypothetical protein
MAPPTSANLVLNQKADMACLSPVHGFPSTGVPLGVRRPAYACQKPAKDKGFSPGGFVSAAKSSFGQAQKQADRAAKKIEQAVQEPNPAQAPPCPNL